MLDSLYFVSFCALASISESPYQTPTPPCHKTLLFLTFLTPDIHITCDLSIWITTLHLSQYRNLLAVLLLPKEMSHVIRRCGIHSRNLDWRYYGLLLDELFERVPSNHKKLGALKILWLVHINLKLQKISTSIWAFSYSIAKGSKFTMIWQQFQKSARITNIPSS